MNDRHPEPGSALGLDLGHSRLDLDRSRRIDLPEAVFCAGKTPRQCDDIVRGFLDASEDAVVATRIRADQHAVLAALDPHPASTDTTMVWRPRRSTGVGVGVVAAGTSDLGVADECRVTLTALGHETRLISDVGVAGLHRLLDALPRLADLDVLVAIAGMEGALPTVLAGLVAQPIVAVPTSVGYGASFDGATALLGMLASCAPGIAVVGIDNGYGAACAVHRMSRLASREARD